LVRVPMPHRAALLLLAQLWPTAAIRHRSVHVLKALAEGCGTRTLGPVLGGIDIVATYVSARQKVEEPPIMGRPQYNFTNDEGFTFYFSSQVTLDVYAESPESYPVGAGGYCGAGCSGTDVNCANDWNSKDPVWGVDHCLGGVCPTSSAAHQIASNGVLYFFRNENSRDHFNLDQAASIANCTETVRLAAQAQGLTCWNTDEYTVEPPDCDYVPPSPPPRADLGAAIRLPYANKALRFLTITRAMGCQASAFADESHVKTQLDYDCQVVMLDMVSSIGHMAGMMDIIEMATDDVIPWDGDDDQLSRWRHSLGGLAVQLAFGCDQVEPSRWASTLGCRELTNSTPPASGIVDEFNFFGGCQASLQSVAVDRLSHEPIHGAMWTLLLEHNRPTKMWQMHTECASDLLANDMGQWKDSCHGMGHGLSWYGPNLTIVRGTTFTNVSQAAMVCKAYDRGLRWPDDICAATCVSGIVHGSAKAGTLYSWASPSHPLYFGESDASVYAVCDGLEFFSLGCYSWMSTNLTYEGCVANLRTASLTNLAGCIAATHLREGSEGTTAQVARASCDSLRTTNYAAFVACTYGIEYERAHPIADGGSYAPWYRPHLLEDEVIPQCAEHDDELALLLCQNEVFDMFSGEWVLNDNRFLQALWQQPESSAVSAFPSSAQAERNRVIDALRTQLHKLAVANRTSLEASRAAA